MEAIHPKGTRRRQQRQRTAAASSSQACRFPVTQSFRSLPRVLNSSGGSPFSHLEHSGFLFYSPSQGQSPADSDTFPQEGGSFWLFPGPILVNISSTPPPSAGAPPLFGTCLISMMIKHKEATATCLGHTLY